MKHCRTCLSVSRDWRTSCAVLRAVPLLAQCALVERCCPFQLVVSSIFLCVTYPATHIAHSAMAQELILLHRRLNPHLYTEGRKKKGREEKREEGRKKGGGKKGEEKGGEKGGRKKGVERKREVRKKRVGRKTGRGKKREKREGRGRGGEK